MKEIPSANLSTCRRAQMAVAAFYLTVKDQRGLYDPQELVPAIGMKLRVIDQAIMNPGSVTISQDLPRTVRESLPEHLRSAFDMELERLEARKLQSQLNLLSKELEDSFAEKPIRVKNAPLLLVPPQSLPLGPFFENAITNFKNEWEHDLPFTLFDTAVQWKEGVRKAFSKLRQKLSFGSRANVPLPMPQ